MTLHISCFRAELEAMLQFFCTIKKIRKDCTSYNILKIKEGCREIMEVQGDRNIFPQWY
jgi:hypothetical protein